jgi:hypothetical protein
MLYIPPSRKIVDPRLGDVQKFGISGRLKAILTDARTGEILQRSVNHNIITRAMLATIPLSWYQARTYYVTEIGVGSGVTTPADTDTTLTTEVDRKAITDPITTTFLTGATPYSIATVHFTVSEANGNLTEAGQFDSNNGLANHALFGTGAITGATQANPVVITDVAHGLTSGTRIKILGVLGMTQINFTGATWYYVSVLTADTFSLYSDAGLTTTVNGTGYSAYSSAGTWYIDIPKTASTNLDVSFEIQAQNA